MVRQGSPLPSPPCLLPVLLPPGQMRLPPLAPPVPSILFVPSLLLYSLSNIPSRPPPLSSSPLGSQPPGPSSYQDDGYPGLMETILAPTVLENYLYYSSWTPSPLSNFSPSSSPHVSSSIPSIYIFIYVNIYIYII